MDVAATISQAPSSLASVTAYSGRTSDGSGVATAASSSTASSSSSSHIPVVGFQYDRSAARLVLLYRDPGSGEIVLQIPSGVAARNYQSAQNAQTAVNRGQGLNLQVVGGTAVETTRTGSGQSTAALTGTTAVTSTPVVTAAAVAAPAVTSAAPAVSTATQSVNVVI